MSVALQVANLTVRRGAAGHRRTVLRGVGCRLDAGEVLMLLGPNGAGKSTLLHTLSGQLVPEVGTVQLAERVLHEWSPAALARHRAVLMQHTAMTLEFTVEEVVRLGALAHARQGPTREAAVEAALAATELLTLRRQPLPALSGGEQARAHLARVLLQLWPYEDDPPAERLLLLDEPCASLDPYYQHQVCRVVRDFARSTGAAVVMSMHDMNLATQYADRVLALVQGQCLAQGAPREVLNSDFVRECFGVRSATFTAGEALLLATYPDSTRGR